MIDQRCADVCRRVRKLYACPQAGVTLCVAADTAGQTLTRSSKSPVARAL